MTGYTIYDNTNPNIKYYFDKTTGGIDDVSTTTNNNRTELRTFGKLPYVYYAGETDYVEFELSTVFIEDDETGLSSREQVNNLKTLLKQRKVLMVENSQGQTFKCDVQITGERSPKLHEKGFLDYIEVTVKCVEIAE